MIMSLEVAGPDARRSSLRKTRKINVLPHRAARAELALQTPASAGSLPLPLPTRRAPRSPGAAQVGAGRSSFPIHRAPARVRAE